MSSEQNYHTVIIGAGQSGLAAGYYLNQHGVSYVILDENIRIGESWRRRWDSLHLFTPSQNNGLPGLKFPRPDFYFPSKDEAADYLEAYQKHFSLAVKLGVKVDSLSKNQHGYEITASDERFHARNVIVAAGAFRTPRTPSMARDLDSSIFQMHSSDYRNPNQLRGQKILVVGAGNSGAEIALDLARASKQVWLAGRDVGTIPADRFGRLLGGRPYWWFLRRVMTNKTPLGRKMKASVLSHGNPLVRVRREVLAESGVEFTPRIAGAMDGKPITEGDRTIPAEAVIWATGFQPEYPWIQLPVFDQAGLPRHERGVVTEAPGLYFLGLLFQTGLTSSLLGGVGEDAKYITTHIVKRQ